MHLDSLSLMVPVAVATAFAGFFLLAANLRFRDMPALQWWAAANLTSAIAIAIIIVGLASGHPLNIIVGTGLTTPFPAMIWAGARRFDNHAAPVPIVAAGIVVWLAISLAPIAGDQKWWWQSQVTLSAYWLYLPAAAWSLWQGRAEPLPARRLLIALFGMHALVFVAASYDLLAGSLSFDQAPRLDTLFGLIIYFEALLFVMGIATGMVLMCKERGEHAFIKAAALDPLTGTANRKSLCEGAERLLNRCRHEGAPCSLVMFDLDHFKEVNDHHGHQIGDRVLTAFADAVKASLRPNDLFGRYGGEEFILVLPGATMTTAHVIADRIRRLFSEDNRFIDGRPLNATVSAGVATDGPESEASYEALIGKADKAVYAAKRAGRNRVASADADTDPVADDTVIRIA